jgi:hypothetical protein
MLSTVDKSLKVEGLKRWHRGKNLGGGKETQRNAATVGRVRLQDFAHTIRSSLLATQNKYLTIPYGR